MSPLNSLNSLNSLMQAWQERDRPFFERGCDGPADATPTTITDRGSRVVLISVHGVNHFNQDGGKKLADLHTGGLALALGEALGLTVITNNRRDPSIDPYLGLTGADRLLCALPSLEQRVVFDIHGMKDASGFDFAIGTSNTVPTDAQNELVARFNDRSRTFGFKTVVNHPSYSARDSCLVTPRALAAGAGAALQIEITRRLRTLGSSHGLEMLAFLTEYFAAVEEGGR